MTFSKIHQLLSNPLMYNFMRFTIGGNNVSKILVKNYIRPSHGDKILDIGCGTGTILDFLPPVEYWGFDLNVDYIAFANARFPHRGKFFCARVSKDTIPEQNMFDIVMACGIFHHLSDIEAMEMFELAHTVLKPGGRFITFDGVYTRDQSYIARLILSNDRGKFVRTEEQYLTIVQKYFADVEVTIRSDLVWIPYTHVILECGK